MNADVKRRLVRRWVRGLLTIGIVLLLPVVFPRLTHGITQRTTVRVTQTSTEVVMPRAAEELESSNLRALIWWSRIIAVVIALGTIAGTVDTIREGRLKDQ